MECSSGAIRTACDIQIVGRRGAGRPKLIWKKLTERDCREWKLKTVDPQERSTWRSSGLRSAMRAASQLMMHLHVNQKSDYDMICFGCTKELSHRDGSFEYPQHMFWLRNKKNNFQLHTLIWRPAQCVMWRFCLC